jgi:hypothetical protein
MAKHLFAAAVAVILCSPQAAGQSILQRSAWQERKFDTYLPPAGMTVPWLDLDTKTRLPKGDLPLGRNVASVEAFALPSTGADRQASSHADSIFRSM